MHHPTYHGLCYTSGGALAGTRNSSHNYFFIKHVRANGTDTSVWMVSNHVISTFFNPGRYVPDYKMASHTIQYFVHDT